jgi:hypothetical protein
MTPSRILAALCAIATFACAQTTITNDLPAVVGFVDLATNGGTPVVPAPSDDSEHNIVTTVGNLLFPAGNVRIANDGVVISGITAGDVASTNAAIPASGFPVGIPAGAAAILPWWQDLCPGGGPPSPAILWKETAGVLYIEWIAEANVCTNSSDVTFEIQVFANPAPGAPWIQILYPDTVFHSGFPLPPPFPDVPPDPCNGGACATIGYVAGSPVASNAQWAHNLASVTNGAVLSIFPPTMALSASSPLGPGSLKLAIAYGPPAGSYFFALTLAPGVFPNGWLFGLDISYVDLAAQLSAGFPFSGSLDAFGGFTLGPIPGVPPLTIHAVAFGFPPGAPVPLTHTAAISHAVP